MTTLGCALPTIPPTATGMPEPLLAGTTRMKHPSRPDTQPDEYIADLPTAHRQPPASPDPDSITRVDTSARPRGEDDDESGGKSPECHGGPGEPERPERERPARGRDSYTAAWRFVVRTPRLALVLCAIVS